MKTALDHMEISIDIMDLRGISSLFHIVCHNNLKEIKSGRV